MSKAAAQQYISTIRLEEKEEIIKALELMEQTKPELTMGMAADIGSRENQQDTSFGQIDDDSAFAVVCDGMGGLDGGELASQTAVQVLVGDYYNLDKKDQMPLFFQNEAYKLNKAVCDLEDGKGRSLEAGTTIVAVHVNKGKAQWLSVGDSKIYVIRKDEILPVNREHNYRLKLDEMLRNKEITPEEYAAEEGRAEALISFLGVGNLELMDINEVPFPLMDEDVILLCSDGLYKALEDELILGVVQLSLPNTQLAAKRLIDAVKEKKVKNQDNTSVVLIQYHTKKEED